MADSKIAGCLYGMALGDALGAVTEFLDMDRIALQFPPLGPQEPEGDPALREKKALVRTLNRKRHLVRIHIPIFDEVERKLSEGRLEEGRGRRLDVLAIDRCSQDYNPTEWSENYRDPPWSSKGNGWVVVNDCPEYRCRYNQ